jgi:hypothetical protein
MTFLDGISGVDSAYKSSTFDVMYCQTAPPFTSILRWSNLELLFAPLHRSGYFIGGMRCQPIQTEHSLYVFSRKNPTSSL